jgi:hypothetical protein
MLAPARLERATQRLRRRDVAGDEMAAIPHLRRKRQGLAAGAGAEIDDPHARPRIGEQRRQLRAFVLHLDEPLAEGLERAERRALEEPEPQRRERRPRRFDAFAQQRRARRLAVLFPEQIDAEVERRPFVERRHLARQRAAEHRLEMRREPGGKIAARLGRHVARLRLLAGERRDEARLIGTEPRRPEPVAVAGRGDRIGRPALQQGQSGKHAMPGIAGEPASALADPPVDERAPAQHGIDVLRDGGAVLGAGEAVAAEIVGDEIVGRRAPRLDLLQQGDRGLDAGPGGHGSPQMSVLSCQSPPVER